MPVDTSMYNTTAPQPFNPLQMMSSVAGIQNMQQQNKLMGQMYGFNQQQNPQLLQAQDLQNKAHQMDLAVKGQTNLVDGLTPLVQQIYDSKSGKAKALTPGDVAIKAKELLDAGVIDPKTYASEMANMPNQPGDELNNWTLQHYQTGQDGLAHVQALQGQMSMVDTHGQQHMMQTSVFGGAPVERARFNNTTSPEFRATPYTFNGPDGTPQNTTVGQFDNAVGAGGGGAASLGGAPSTPQGPAAAPQNPLAAAAGTPPPQARPAVRGAIAGPAPGVVDAAKQTGAANAQQGINLQSLADTVPQRKAALGEMASTLTGFNSGVSSGATAKLKSLANTLGLHVDTDGLKDQEVFTKLGTSIALQQVQALGGVGSDDKLSAAIHTNPGTAFSNMGNKTLLHILQGNEDAIAAKNQAWQKWKSTNGPSSYGDFASKFNQSFDPRVFQMQYMSPAEKQDLMRGMGAQEKLKFRDSVRQSIDNGWVTPSTKPSAGQ